MPHGRRKGQRGSNRRMTSGQVSGSGEGSRNFGVRLAANRKFSRLPKVNDSAPNPSKELSEDAEKKFQNPFGVVGRARKDNN